MPTYEVTYMFDGHYSGTPAEVIERSFEALAALQAHEVDIEHLGGTVTLGANGTVSDCTSRYSAPTEGHVGWLAVRALLPISGIRRLDAPDTGSEHAAGRARPHSV
jgi:hypothetical protein